MIAYEIHISCDGIEGICSKGNVISDCFTTPDLDDMFDLAKAKGWWIQPKYKTRSPRILCAGCRKLSLEQQQQQQQQTKNTHTS